MTLTSYSFFEKYFGSEPATSARPPVLINGTASDVTNNTRFISVTPKSDTLFTNTQCIFRCAFFRSASRKPLVFSMYGHSPYQPTEIRDTLCKHSIVFLSAALLIAYAHYTTLWGSRKYLNCLIQIPYFAAVL